MTQGNQQALQALPQLPSSSIIHFNVLTFNIINKIPVLKFLDQSGNCRYLLLDSGAQISIIQENCIPKENLPYINSNHIIKITGISDKSINSIGSYNISLFDLQCNFNVVQNDFVVKSVRGILKK